MASDDGTRLWVNNQQLINNWVGQSITTKTGDITLVIIIKILIINIKCFSYINFFLQTAGVKYSIKLEYYEATGNAAINLQWSHASVPKVLIPTSRLYVN